MTQSKAIGARRSRNRPRADAPTGDTVADRSVGPEESGSWTSTPEPGSTTDRDETFPEAPPEETVEDPRLYRWVNREPENPSFINEQPVNRPQLGGMFKPDDVDRKLIEELRRDSRTPATVLARRLKIPRVTIQYRLRRLRKTGLIHRFTVLVDRKMDGKELTAFTLIRVSPGYQNTRRLGGAISRIPGVVEVHDVTGSSDFVVKIHAGHVREIGQVVNRIRVTPGVSATETLTSVNTYKEEF